MKTFAQMVQVKVDFGVTVRTNNTWWEGFKSYFQNSLEISSSFTSQVLWNKSIWYMACQSWSIVWFILSFNYPCHFSDNSFVDIQKYLMCHIVIEKSFLNMYNRILVIYSYNYEPLTEISCSWHFHQEWESPNGDSNGPKYQSSRDVLYPERLRGLGGYHVGIDRWVKWHLKLSETG